MGKIESILNEVFPGWEYKIKTRRYREGQKRYYIHVGRKLQRQLNAASDYYSAPTYKDLLDVLYSAFKQTNATTLNMVIDQYVAYRVNVGTNSKTVKEDIYSWNRYFRNSDLAEVPLTEITSSMIRDEFLKLTADYKLTRICFKTAKGLLNNMLEFCIDKELLHDNPMSRVNYKQFNKRLKPVNPDHNDYSREEINNLIQYFRDHEEDKDFSIYDYAVWFALNSCLRIGEIKALRKSDFKDGKYRITKAVISRQEMYLDENNEVQWGKTKHIVSAPKGNASSGFRTLPTTEDIEYILKKLEKKYPNNEFLFMNEGMQIQTKAFNNHLKKACLALDIEYRSSHYIRFSNCDGLFYNGGVEMNDMQSFMGHTSPTMTAHYLNRHSASTTGIERAREYLSSAIPLEKPCSD